MVFKELLAKLPFLPLVVIENWWHLWQSCYFCLPKSLDFFSKRKSDERGKCLGVEKALGTF